MPERDCLPKSILRQISREVRNAFLTNAGGGAASVASFLEPHGFHFGRIEIGNNYLKLRIRNHYVPASRSARHFGSKHQEVSHSIVPFRPKASETSTKQFDIQPEVSCLRAANVER